MLQRFIDRLIFFAKSTFLVLSVFFLFSACAKKSNKNSIRIATAANMQFAMNELAEAFTQKTGIACELVFSSSGKLTAQIQEGAPYDVFVAADTKYPETLYEHQMTLHKPEIYAYGKLVLWSYDALPQPQLTDLTSAVVQHIALANPKTAPYGTAAIEVLKNKGIYEQVAGKLVYGESIAQTNQFIVSGAAEIGFTALAVVLSPAQRGNGSYTPIAENLYTPLAQAAVVLKHNLERTENAQKFYAYLFSPEAQKILKDFGYSVHE